jgi:hypothetical protein
MKNIMIFLSLLSPVIFTFTSCYNDNEVDLYPFQYGPCDSLNVTYTGAIAQIMSANCNVCHSTALANGNVVTDNYASLSSVAASGQLWAAVNWEPGVIPMPNGGSQLSSCDLAKIKNWINSGLPNK